MLLLEVNVEGFECFPHVDASAVSFLSADGLRALKSTTRQCANDVRRQQFHQLLNGQKASVLTLGKARDSLLTLRCQPTLCYRHQVG